MKNDERTCDLCGGTDEEVHEELGRHARLEHCIKELAAKMAKKPARRKKKSVKPS